jgi:hypothetical protein
MNLGPTTVLISAERSNLTERENVYRTAEMRELLGSMGLGFKEVRGVYRGVHEASFVVIGQEVVSRMLELAAKFNQESILVIDPARTAYLAYLRGGKVNEFYLEGVMQQIPKEKALQLPAYTQDGDTYYAVI